MAALIVNWTHFTSYHRTWWFLQRKILNMRHIGYHMLLCVGIKGLIRIRLVIIRYGIVIVIRDVIISRVCVEIMGGELE